jgi:hypothetical protein
MNKGEHASTQSLYDWGGKGVVWPSQERTLAVYNICDLYRLVQSFFNFVEWFMALCFTATGALLAARHIQILPMNQHA